MELDIKIILLIIPTLVIYQNFYYVLKYFLI